MSLFEERKQVSRRELRKELGKASPFIPGTHRKYSREERIEFEKEFGKKDGDQISEKDFKNKIYKFGEDRKAAKTEAERSKIKDKIDFFKERGGFK